MTDRLRAAALVTVLVVAGHPAAAEKLGFKAALTPKNEVPPMESPASGAAEITLDTASRELTWTITFEKLTAAVRAAHFHGAAAPNQNAPVVLPVGGRDATSPLKGSRVLTPEQMEGLIAGRWYINIHTATHPPGEIRGQVERR